MLGSAHLGHPAVTYLLLLTYFTYLLTYLLLTYLLTYYLLLTYLGHPAESEGDLPHVRIHGEVVAAQAEH